MNKNLGVIMLDSLYIKDFVLIDELSIDLHEGYNIITGETGAGKSIVVKALSLLMGARAQNDMIRSGCDKAIVSGTFTKISASIWRLCENLGCDKSDELLVVRTISKQNRGRILINGIPVSLSQLKMIMIKLLDISSQHEHQLLLYADYHRHIVDAFGHCHEELSQFQECFNDYNLLKADIAELKLRQANRDEHIDFMQHQYNEIMALNPQPNEIEQLESEQRKLKYSVNLEEKIRDAENILYNNSGACLELIDAAIHNVEVCEEYDPSVKPWMDSLYHARAYIDDISRDMQMYVNSLESDPARLEEIEDRLYAIRKLIRKHGDSIESCLERAKTIKSDMDALVHFDAIIDEKEALQAIAYKKVKTFASKLSKKRHQSSVSLEKIISNHLIELGMRELEFKILIRSLSDKDINEFGADNVQIMFSPNEGEPLRALARIASGGELSRVMLAIKTSISASSDSLSVSVFDEVDTGVGGSIAEAVGRKLKQLSSHHQVVCITHLPQVAIYANMHICISKTVCQGRAVSQLNALSITDRIDEIARMLGGEVITSATKLHAKELLTMAQKHAKS